MKKVTCLVIMASMLMSLVSCNQKKQPTQNENVDEVLNTADTIAEDDSDLSMGYCPISGMDMWLRMSPSDLQTEQLKRLADLYNAAAIMNSAITDYDLALREYAVDEVIDAIESIDVTKVKEPEVQSKLSDYKKEMLYLLSVDPDSIDQTEHNPWKAKKDLCIYLVEKYHVSTFGELNEELYDEEFNQCSNVPEWSELQEKRGDDNMVEELKEKYENAKNFDARCIYAIELAHAYEADRDSWGEDYDRNPAIPIMETLMDEKKYSLYLNEIWLKWRVLYQDSKGASRDSEIPNNIYNGYRNKCACTTLSHIQKHPYHIMAINEYLVMACRDNILRDGVFPYGNQNVIEKYYLFPEVYDKEDE